MVINYVLIGINKKVVESGKGEFSGNKYFEYLFANQDDFYDDVQMKRNVFIPKEGGQELEKRHDSMMLKFSDPAKREEVLNDPTMKMLVEKILVETPKYIVTSKDANGNITNTEKNHMEVRIRLIPNLNPNTKAQQPYVHEKSPLAEALRIIAKQHKFVSEEKEPDASTDLFEEEVAETLTDDELKAVESMLKMDKSTEEIQLIIPGYKG